MKKIGRMLAILFSFSLFMGIYGSASAIPELKKTKRQINSIVNANNNKDDKKSAKNKLKEKMEANKKKIEEEKNKLKKNLKQDVKKAEEKVKDKKEQVNKKVQKEKDKVEKNLENAKNKAENVKNDLKNKIKEVMDVNFNNNKSFSIPVNINSNSNYVKAIILQDLTKKLNEQNLIKNEKKDENNKEKKQLNLNFRLYDILKNNKNENRLFLDVDENYGNVLEKGIDTKKLDDFAKNYSLKKEDFEKSKKDIIDRLNKDKATLEKNINTIKKNEVQFNVSPLVDLKDATKNSEKFYNSFLKYPLKEFDEKLYHKINEKISNEEEKNNFFKNSFENSKKFYNNTQNEKLNDSYKKLTSWDGYIKKFEKLNYYGIDKNFKIEKISKIDKSSKENDDLEGITEISNVLNFKPNELIVGYFDSLDLTNEEKMEFVNYYEEDLKKLKEKKEDNKQLKEKTSKIIDQMFKAGSILNGVTTKEDIENAKKKNLIFGENYKSFKEKYCETLINHIKKQIFKSE